MPLTICPRSIYPRGTYQRSSFPRASTHIGSAHVAYAPKGVYWPGVYKRDGMAWLRYGFHLRTKITSVPRFLLDTKTPDFRRQRCYKYLKGSTRRRKIWCTRHHVLNLNRLTQRTQLQQPVDTYSTARQSEAINNAHCHDRPTFEPQNKLMSHSMHMNYNLVIWTVLKMEMRVAAPIV